MFTGAVSAVFSYRLTTFSYNSAIATLCQILLKHIRLYDCLWRSQFQTTLHQKHEKQILSNIIKSSQEIQCTLFKNASNNSVEKSFKIVRNNFLSCQIFKGSCMGISHHGFKLHFCIK